ncbi:hypothetical protein B0T21DRAFT_349506 [Apiosordaria backusii]|uniref:Uncharacterized protein n=1 Tax=Apiosordaria backusii TaxID=314023 RepID=A0AA40BEM6_9PEZI|nr:hypothetical protein B0T21DRAFT_349506 [Apiosordaria backusii]
MDSIQPTWQDGVGDMIITVESNFRPGSAPNRVKIKPCCQVRLVVVFGFGRAEWADRRALNLYFNLAFVVEDVHVSSERCSNGLALPTLAKRKSLGRVQLNSSSSPGYSTTAREHPLFLPSSSGADNDPSTVFRCIDLEIFTSILSCRQPAPPLPIQSPCATFCPLPTLHLPSLPRSPFSLLGAAEMAADNSFSAAAFAPSRGVTPCRPLPLIGEEDIEMGGMNRRRRLHAQPITVRSFSLARKCGLGGWIAVFVDLCVFSMALALVLGAVLGLIQ